MRYLSFDIEATGLDEDCLMIEFGCVPFDGKTKQIENKLTFHSYIQCPSFEELEPKLDTWVKENNKELITKAHETGLEMSAFKVAFEDYLQSYDVLKYFEGQKIVLFGKSINAIDLPFLNRGLGWDWMRKNFHFRTFDFSAYTFGLMDMGLLPEGSDSGSNLMKLLGMGEVAHTALEDAVATAEMYLKVLARIEKGE